MSGFALEAATMFKESGRYARIAFVSKGASDRKTFAGFAVAGSDDELADLRKEFDTCFVAIGEPSVRRRVADSYAALGFTLASQVHATAWVSADVAITPGTIVYPHATIMVGCRLGAGCLVNTNASIGHETSLGEFVNVQPGANIAGQVVVGDEAYVGIGAVILETRRVGARAVVGGGAVVTRDVAAGVTVTGVPARPRP